MTTPRKCYQCDDDQPPMSEVQAARKAEIKEYARQQVEEAEAAILVEDERFRSGREISDWDLIIQPETEEPPVVEEVLRMEQLDALAATEEQDAHADRVAASPGPSAQADLGAPATKAAPTKAAAAAAAAPAKSVPFEKSQVRERKPKKADKVTNATITGDVTITPDSE